MSLEKSLIRQYEELKQKQAVTLEDYIGLESEWFKLHKLMARTLKTLSTRAKGPFKPFIKKSLAETKLVSSKVFQLLTKEYTKACDKDFTKWMHLESHTYFKGGARSIIQLMLERSKSSETVKDLMEAYQQRERVRLLPQEWFLNTSQELLQKPYETLVDIYYLEEQIQELFLWWDYTNTGEKRTNAEKKARKQLRIHHVTLANAMLELQGYSLSFSHALKSENGMNILHEHGMQKAVYLFEKNYDMVSPMIEEVMQTLPLLHPRDEFKSVRDMKRHFVIRLGDTNTGKTGGALDVLKRASSGYFLGPIRELANEVYEKLNHEGVPCSLKTGERVIEVPNAYHVSLTVEAASLQQKVEVAVLDEVQYVSEKTRGGAWLRALYGLRADTIYLCGAPHALPFLTRVIEECGDTYEVHMFERKVPLQLEKEPFCFPYSSQPGDAYIVFSKHHANKLWRELNQIGISASVVYGKMPYETRKAQIDAFVSRENEVIIATNTIGIGVNLPIRRIVFMESEIWNGTEYRPLTIQEVKQIAGRAGRKGMYEVGFVNAVKDKDLLFQKLVAVEDDIQKSYMNPSRELTRGGVGTLRQRLLAWKQAPYHDNIAQKANVDEKIRLLQEIERWEPLVGSEMLYKALNVSFNTLIGKVVGKWRDYVKELAEGATTLKRPVFKDKSVEGCEIYHQQLLLYASFSKKFGLDYDGEWVARQKKETAYIMNYDLRVQSYQQASSY